VADDANLGLDILALQQHQGAADGEFADAAAGKSAAEDDAFGVFPIFKLEKAAPHASELLREGFGRPLHDAG